jgi:mRNA interferase RelE/StbE
VKYSILFTESADKQLQKLSASVQRLIVDKIKKLDINQPNNNIKKLVGFLDFYRLCVGDYRVVYQIKHDKLIVLIVKVGHRKNVYDF